MPLVMKRYCRRCLGPLTLTDAGALVCLPCETPRTPPRSHQ